MTFASLFKFVSGQDLIEFYNLQGLGYAVPIFISLSLSSIYLILNMTLAVVIDGMQSAQQDNENFFKGSDIDEFIDKW